MRGLRTPYAAAAALLFVMCWPSSGGARDADADASVSAAADRVARQVMAPCCFVNTVAEHDSPVSRRVRVEIRDGDASAAERDTGSQLPLRIEHMHMVPFLFVAMFQIESDLD